MEQPLVSCITPTANREKYLPLAIGYFLAQDYPNIEMIILDDGRKSSADLIPDDPRIRYYYYNEPIGTIGNKRNLACEMAKGEIIVHFDDDDYYASDWVSRQVEAQLSSGANITGMNNVDFYSAIDDRRYRYEDKLQEKPWLCGATMAYKKSFWEGHRFDDIQVGEDYDFVWSNNPTIYAFEYITGFVAILHPHNTTLKPVEDPKRKKHAMGWAGAKDYDESQRGAVDPLIASFCDPEIYNSEADKTYSQNNPAS